VLRQQWTAILTRKHSGISSATLEMGVDKLERETNPCTVLAFTNEKLTQKQTLLSRINMNETKNVRHSHIMAWLYFYSVKLAAYACVAR